MIAYTLFQLPGADMIVGLLIILFFLLIGVIILYLKLSRLEKQYRAAMEAVDGSDIEQMLADQRSMLYQQAEHLEYLQEQADMLHEKITNHAGHVGIVRFNPFQDMGGNQSFAAAWLDQNGTGMVLSSLYTRAGSRIYAKPVQNRQSSFTLTAEEQQAIGLALADQLLLESSEVSKEREQSTVSKSSESGKSSDSSDSNDSDKSDEFANEEEPDDPSDLNHKNNEVLGLPPV